MVKAYNASIFFDQRMYNEDIDGSIAHVTMLGKQGIVTEEEAKTIVAAWRTSARTSPPARSYSTWMTRTSTWVSRAA